MSVCVCVCMSVYECACVCVLSAVGGVGGVYGDGLLRDQLVCVCE